MHNMRLSEGQSEAVRHVDGPMMVIAGPGSGKTTVITNRVKYLIESAGVRPADILVITFTRAAAGEMERRFRALVRGKEYPVRFGTFHSVFYWIIKTAYGNSGIRVIGEEEKRRLVEQLLASMEFRFENHEDIVNSILSQISLVKADRMDIESYYSRDMPEVGFRELYKRLDEELKRRGMIDFDDMMVLCYELLTNRPDILESCRKLFPYILVDEFQDSNRIQYDIFRLLANPLQNAFVVGDDDQSVYGFRGARPEIMQQFRKDFPKTKLVCLGENYRSDSKIVHASAQVIQHNKARFKKPLAACSGEQGCVRLHVMKNAVDENESIVEQIRGYYRAGIPYEEQAVLYRTNLQPRRLAYKLEGYNIPYTISDAMPNLFRHFAVRYMLDYMRLAMGDFSRERFLRIMNRPVRYISREVLSEDPVDFDRLRFRLREKDYALENLEKLIADIGLLRKLRPLPAYNFIRNFIGYDSYLRTYAGEHGIDVSDLFDVLDEFAYMIADMNSYGELFEFIDQYTMQLAAQQEKKREQRHRLQGVRLLTMHSAKGLEFDTVYIPDAVEGLTPYKKAKTAAQLEEERRMFYVAMTRARHNLHIYVPELTAGKPCEQSRFVKEIAWQKSEIVT